MEGVITTVHQSSYYSFFRKPSFRGSDKQLAQHPSLVILVVSDCVVEFVANSDLTRKRRINSKLIWIKSNRLDFAQMEKKNICTETEHSEMSRESYRIHSWNV